MRDRLAPLATRARALRSRATLERDYWSFRRRYGEILSDPLPRTGRVALIASLTYSTYQAKLEGMIARAFAHAGLEPVAVVLPDAAMARRYLELFGVRRFGHLADFLDDAGEHRAGREGEALLDGVSRPADLKDLTFRGADVGRQALSTVSRYLHEGGVDLADPRARSLLAELLPAAVRTAIASEALLDRYGPELVLFNERNYADQGPLCDIALARGLNVVQFVGGFEDDTLVFKRYTEETKGLHPRSIADESWPWVAAMPWTAEQERELEAEFARRYDKSATFLARWNQGWTRRQSRDEIAAKLALDPAKRTAVVGQRLEAEARQRHGRARRARGDSRADRRASSPRRPASAGYRHQHLVALRRHRLGRHDPRLHRLRAAVLRQARAHRRNRLLLGSGVHGRLRDAGGVPGTTAVDRDDPAADCGRGNARAQARLRPLPPAPDPFHDLPLGLSAGRARRSAVRGLDRAHRALGAGAQAGARPTTPRRLGRPLASAGLPRAAWGNRGFPHEPPPSR
jgi:hypothetical protein